MTPLASYPEDVLHEQMNGQTSNLAPDIAVVNPTEALPTGVGPGNVQPFMSGASQNVRTTWVEQGWGHSSQRWAYYPFSEGDNPARVKSRLSSIPAAERENYGTASWDPILGPNHERQALSQIHRQSGANVHGAIVDIPTAAPWTDTIPTYGGGAVPHPGIDIPLGALYQ